ncbi:MAG: RluA family pseudouridine synthase [Oscillospiraceae bacterium]|nr:RluA family pseudouridine synthase [Oscillospiraceae bacterium]
MTLTHIAERDGKLLSFLRRELRLSSGLVGRLKWQNCFFVDGAPAHTDHPVKVGQTIEVQIKEKPAGFTAEHTPITVLYEDDALLAVDKPAGVIAHPTFNRTEGTLLTQVLGYYERTGQDCAVHTVNRLDRDTVGVVLFAKNAHVHGLCYRLQRAGRFEKTYHAVCFGAPPQSEGVCELPIGRVDGGSLLRKIDADGAPARTEYRVLAQNGGFSLLELHPVTGRTHQLRLHCLALGCPILGDPQYQTAESAEASARLGLSAQQLAAVTLTLPHPMTGERLTVVSHQDVFLP